MSPSIYKNSATLGKNKFMVSHDKLENYFLISLYINKVYYFFFIASTELKPQSIPSFEKVFTFCSILIISKTFFRADI